MVIALPAGLGAIAEDVDGKSRSRNRKRAQKRKRNAKKQCDFKGRRVRQRQTTVSK